MRLFVGQSSLQTGSTRYIKTETIGVVVPVTEELFTASDFPIGVDGEARRDATTRPKAHHQAESSGLIDLHEVFENYV